MDKKLSNKPIKVGDLIKTSVLRVGKNGDPLIVYKDFMIFLKLKPKQTFEINRQITLKIIKVKPKFAHAEVVYGI